MNLNCRPGDLARVISTPETDYVGITDRIIKVTQISEFKTPMGYVAWDYETMPLSVPCPCGCGRNALIGPIADSALRPIRDPGDDAVDETLELAPPVPGTKELVST